MKKEEIKTIKYNLYNIKSDKFSVNKVFIRFNLPLEKEKINVANLLTNYMQRSNKKYPTSKDVYKESEKRFVLGFSSNILYTHNLLCFSVEIAFLDERYVSKEKIDDIFSFVFDCLYEVSFEENEQNQNSLELGINKAIKRIKKEKEDKSSYAQKRCNEIFFENTPLAYNYNGDIDSLNKIKIKDLEVFYYELLNSANIDIFSITNYEASDFNNKLFNYFNERKNPFYELNHYKANDLKAKELKEQIVANQSILKMGYVFEELNEYEKYAVLPMFSQIFGGSGSAILFQEVREKHSLCYYINARGDFKTNSLLISSGINASNYDLTKNLVISELEKVKEGIIDDELIESARMMLINNQKAKIDSKTALLLSYEAIVYKLSIDELSKIELLKKVSKEDLVAFANKLKLSLVYLLEGVDKLD
jgi:predicted Zn-dependent peptidase